jgi:K+-transporting ATPase KdpF subunit
LKQEENHGYRLHRTHPDFFRRHRRTGFRVRQIAEAFMTFTILLSSVLTLVIFVYLLVALFFPEKF